MSFVFEKLDIPDIIAVKPEKFQDERGFFSELFQQKIFSDAGIGKQIKQVNLSRSSKGVLRGLHYQLKPYAQGKIVRAVSGRIFDVAVDLRKNSPYFGKWAGIELDCESLSMVFIPEGFAHGFEVLSESAEFEYLCTEFYSPEHERGIIYNDPDINIAWKTEKPIVSQKDSNYPFFKDAQYDF